jgi:hypothetical protein
VLSTQQGIITVARQPHLTHHLSISSPAHQPPAIPSLPTSSQEQLSKEHHKNPSIVIRDHGHLEEHQVLIKRRSKAARK